MKPMTKKYWAHSLPGKPQEEWQLLEDHMQKAAEMASAFAIQFQSSDWAWNAALLHDLGKSDERFQGYLLRENGLDDTEYDSGRVNHSSVGAALAENQYGPCAGRVLAYITAGHHAGLADWIGGLSSLSERFKEGNENLEMISQYVNDFAKKLKPSLIPPEFARKSENMHLWTRMLYSCLVDADFLDTEEFMSKEKSSIRDVVAYTKLSDLKIKFDAHMDAFMEIAQKTEVNIIRREVLRVCREAASKKLGLFSLNVPTGGGKTLSGIAFALNHAVIHKKLRIIYVIPYTSIIEQTAQILRGIFGDENVVEHHSNLDPEKETQRSRLATENWDAPIIVTTNVQFFESLYAARSSRCRKLHNIVNSVVILDEAQLLPPKLLTPCVDIMNQLVRHYGVTMVLSTATQPSLPNLDIPENIIPPSMRLNERLKRTEIHIPSDLNEVTDWESLSNQLQQYKQVLCVVNTRRDCYDLFKHMPEGTIHLSALMCGEHRSHTIAKIKQHLADGLPVRVISTQLVEAGVDIDFPVVYRALAGFDSLAQTAGRCNREGKLNAEGKMGAVHVFVPPKPSPRGLLRKGEDKTRELISCGISPFSPDAFHKYFKIFYASLNDTGTRFHDLLVRDVNPKVNIQFRTAAAEFKLIDDQAQRMVFVKYGDSDKWIKQVRAIGPTRESMRHLQRFTINLSKCNFERARTDGLIEDIWKGEYFYWVPTYDNVVGMDIFGAGWTPEDLMQ
jgi:CRISPR-associated endonuclease/helicase Cas3